MKNKSLFNFVIGDVRLDLKYIPETEQYGNYVDDKLLHTYEDEYSARDEMMFIILTYLNNYIGYDDSSENLIN